MSSAPADIPVDDFTRQTVDKLIECKDNETEQDKCIREWASHIRSANVPVLFWDFLHVGPAAWTPLNDKYQISSEMQKADNNLKVRNNIYEILCDGDGLIGTCTMDQRRHRTHFSEGLPFYEIRFNIIKKKIKNGVYEDIIIPRYHIGFGQELSPHKVIANASGIQVPDKVNQYLLTFETNPSLYLDASRSNTLEKILKNIKNKKSPYDGMIARNKLKKKWGLYETNSQFFWGNATIQKITDSTPSSTPGSIPSSIPSSTPGSTSGGRKSRKNKKRFIKKKSYNRRRRSRNISLNKR